MNAAAPLVLDRRSVREVDRAAIADYGIPGIVLMENAARALADEAIRMLATAGCKPGRTPGSVLIVCGPGNNGGDGYASARHLHNHGVAVTLAPIGEPREGSDAAVNARIGRLMNLPLVRLDDAALGERDLIIDALLGTGLERPVEGEAASAIAWMNRAGVPVLAADVPSGLDCDTGRALGDAVRAARTVTFVALKPGFLVPSSRAYTGDVVVADIGAPRELIERLARASMAPRPLG
jgi:NAD(P)H-hydrate epimerase